MGIPRSPADIVEELKSGMSCARDSIGTDVERRLGESALNKTIRRAPKHLRSAASQAFRQPYGRPRFEPAAPGRPSGASIARSARAAGRSSHFATVATADRSRAHNVASRIDMRPLS